VCRCVTLPIQVPTYSDSLSNIFRIPVGINIMGTKLSFPVQVVLRCSRRRIIYSVKDIKGIVQRDLRGAENRLKRSVLMNYITAQLCFLILKGHHHNSGKKPDLASSQQLN
jgi:hypothetical protein